jgi:hypothetical protein
MSNSLDGLRKRLDTLFMVIASSQVQEPAGDEQVMVHLPVKTDASPVAYQRGPVYFYVPGERQHEQQH